MKLGFIIVGLICSLVLSQDNKLVFDQNCEGYQTYNISNNGLNLEYETNIGLSIDPTAQFTLKTEEIGKRPRCHNIVVGKTEIVFTEELVFPYYDKDSNRLDIVVPLAATPTAATQDETITQMLKLLKSPDYLGSVWIKRSDKRNEILLNKSLSIIADTFNNLSQACPTESIAAGDRKIFNCIFKDTAIDDYFLNEISYNWALWVLIFYLLGYFFIILCFEDVTPTEYTEESNWTFHPMVSIYTRGSEIFTKQSRMAQYFFFMGSLSFFTALMHIKWYNEHLAIRLLVFPIFGTFFALITTFISGIFLNLRYNTNKEYIKGHKLAENLDQKKQNLDRYEKSEYQINYIFYMVLLIAMFNFTIWPIIILHDLPLSTQGYWVVGIIIGVAFDLLLWRVAMVYLARIAFFKKLYKVYGFYYDAQLHAEYNSIVGYKM